jgi:hypothetical protein
MKKQDFKKLIKPIVKECINEAILESGLLSNVISEVVKGLGIQALNEQKAVKSTEQKRNNVIAEQKRNNAIAEQKRKLSNEKLDATRKKLLNSINKDAYGGVNVFEGTTPMNGAGSTKAPSPAGALAGQSPDDPGIDISGILNIGADKWSKLV